MNDEIQKIKLQIKQWEYQFLSDHGRKPSHDDIKKNTEIHAKYKVYNKQKLTDKNISTKLKPSTESRLQYVKSPSRSPSRSYRNDPTIQYIPKSPSKISKINNNLPSTPQKKNQQIMAAILEAKVGPTPQMNGRVLGIFEFGSPDIILQTPSKGIVETTPSKKRIIENIISTPSKLSAKHSPSLPGNITTPIKSKSSSPTNLQLTPIKTPTYLNHGISTIGDSPLPPRRLNRSLSSMMAELRDIKEEQENNNGGFDPDGFDLNELSDFDDDFDSDNNPLPPNPDKQFSTYKKKTQKRTTKRVKMKPTYNANDPIDETNPIKSLPKKQGDNFQRLKLKNSGYKTNKAKFFLGRRSR